MNRADYIKELEKFTVDTKKVEIIEKKYNTSLSEVVKKIVSNSEESVFFDDDYRILSFAEIEDAESDLHVNFAEKGIIPIADCGENDFIVYHYNDDFWSKFNIIDDTVFKKQKSLEDFLK